MNKKEESIEGLIFLIIGFIFVSIGLFCWYKIPNSVLVIAGCYFGGQFIGMGREILSK